MKQPFFKQVFKLRVMASVTVLLGVTFLLHACSDDNIENPNTDATESIEVGNENSMKLMVDGQFEKNLKSMNDVEDGAYAYVIVNSKTANTIRAYTTEEHFKRDAQYNELTSKMTKKATILPDFNMNEILAEERVERSKGKVPAVNGKAVHPDTNFDHVAEHPWPDHVDLVGHFEIDGSSYDTHYSIELVTDLNLYNGSYHYHYDDLEFVGIASYNGRLKYCLQYADHSIIQNPNPNTSYVFLYTGTNRTGTQYFFSIAKYDYVDIPNRVYNTISLYN
ncbi:hypothetical protein KORDIASMS9_04065 [Kordia sp. SMS9]|uniref:hypothetical protein n=1 Tax=Kordia sp. SMS9 TaxID=2282170 RepID=UPI000E106F5A|nr:hypothetical protein [Kordia sp. SMS9]AXG71807.1 hypothetical protein KORDIASMS9_04065 [Kordia sp. SMS9]